MNKIIFTGGLLINGTGEVIEGYPMVVVEDKKLNIRDLSWIQNKEGTVIDITGKTIVPGLIDTHLHFSIN